MTKKLADIRNELSVVLTELSQNGASTKDVVKAFRVQHSTLIARASEDLENVGLTKLVNDIRGRRSPRSLEPDAPELFGQFKLPHVIAVPASVKGGRTFHENRLIASLTYSEAEAHVKRQTRQRVVSNFNDIREWRRLLKMAKPHMRTSEMTIGEGIAAAIAAEKPESKKDD